MISMTILIAVIAMAISTLLVQHRTFWVQVQMGELHDRLRDAHTMLVRDLRSAGYGMPTNSGEISHWVTWVSSVTQHVQIVEGASDDDPDSVSLVGAFAAPVTALATTAAEDDTSITVGSGDGALFDTSVNKLVFIGHIELARVVGVSGDTLMISTHPTDDEVGLNLLHEAGSAIELVEVITYSLMTNASGFPRLVRDANDSSVPSSAVETRVEAIEDMQLAKEMDGRVTDCELTGRAQSEDFRYKHPEKLDRLRRAELSNKAWSRNPI